MRVVHSRTVRLDPSAHFTHPTLCSYPTASHPADILSDTVSICHVPTCTCADFTFRRTPCKHLIYTMVKVLKVASTSPLLHQYALTSTELQSIFDNAPAAACIGLSASADEEEEEHSNRKSIEGDCPICFMDFGESKQTTTWCREFCGNNVHESCMRTWLSVQKRQYGKGTCPYCRGDWAEA